MPKRKDNDVVDENLGQEEAINLGEVGDPGPIEKAVEGDVKMEAFMNDLLEIVVHETGNEGDLPVICPQVNGTNQPIIRGRKTMVKRKYVEALARCTTTKYTQTTPDAAHPDNMQMIPRRSLTYPFTVVRDPHPKGDAWLDMIKAQPA